MPRKIKPAETKESAVPAASGAEGKIDKPTKRRPSASQPPVKKTAARRPKTPAKSPQPKAGGGPSDEQIQTRAYFISERRHRVGLPGDVSADWLEAKRQLLSELGPR